MESRKLSAIFGLNSQPADNRILRLLISAKNLKSENLSLEVSNVPTNLLLLYCENQRKSTWRTFWPCVLHRKFHTRTASFTMAKFRVSNDLDSSIWGRARAKTPRFAFPLSYESPNFWLLSNDARESRLCPHDRRLCFENNIDCLTFALGKDTLILLTT